LAGRNKSGFCWWCNCHVHLFVLVPRVIRLQLRHWVLRLSCSSCQESNSLCPGNLLPLSSRAPIASPRPMRACRRTQALYARIGGGQGQHGGRAPGWLSWRVEHGPADHGRCPGPDVSRLPHDQWRGWCAAPTPGCQAGARWRRIRCGALRGRCK